MSCTQYNPCHQTTCTDCNPVNPCYDNCGCINPTDWECVNNPGTLSGLEVINTDNGKTVLSKIDSKISSIISSLGLVKADETDVQYDNLFDKLSAGTGITLAITTVDGDRKVEINATTGGTVPYTVKVEAAGTAGYLYDKVTDGTYVKKSISADKIKFDITPVSLISSDAGNQLSIGGDGKLRTLYTAPDGSETRIVAGTGANVAGIGTSLDPYIISTNPSITAAKACFDNVWKNVTFSTVLPSGVSHISSTVKYRKRFDGSIEFKGTASFQVQFTGNGIVTCANVSTSVASELIGTNPCYSITNLTPTIDLKSVSYFDSSNVVDGAIKMTSYLIRFGSGNITLVFGSTTAATKTITLSFDGAIYHPNL